MILLPDVMVRLARATGVVLHPVVVGFIVALYAAIDHEGALTTRLFGVAAIVSALCLGLPALSLGIAWCLGRTGGDLFAERRRTRIYLYPASLVGLLGSYLVFEFLYPFALARTLVAAAIATTALMAIANRWLKVSIHCAGNAGIAIGACAAFGLFATPLLATVPIVAWARVVAKNHTIAEAIAGTVIGAATTLLCVALIGEV